jgi:hypothetical protein
MIGNYSWRLFLKMVVMKGSPPFQLLTSKPML